MFVDGILDTTYYNKLVPPNPYPSLQLRLSGELKLHPGAKLYTNWLEVVDSDRITIDNSALISARGLGEDNIGGGIDYASGGASGAGHGGSGGQGHKQVRNLKL